MAGWWAALGYKGWEKLKVGHQYSKRQSLPINICTFKKKKKRHFDDVLGPENQMLQSYLNNYLEINLLLMTFFWIYNVEHFPGSEGSGDWQVHLLVSGQWCWEVAWGGAEGLLGDFMSQSSSLTVLPPHSPAIQSSLRLPIWLLSGLLFPLKAIVHGYLILPVSKCALGRWNLGMKEHTVDKSSKSLSPPSWSVSFPEKRMAICCSVGAAWHTA